MSSTTQKASETVGDKTNGAVGDQTIINEATVLAKDTIDYAKGVVGLGGTKSHTLGDLVNEARDLTANVIGTAESYIASGVDKSKEAGSDTYVGKARDTAASILSTAQTYVASAQKKADSTSTNDIKAAASDKANDIAATVNAKTSDLQGRK